MCHGELKLCIRIVFFRAFIIHTTSACFSQPFTLQANEDYMDVSYAEGLANYYIQSRFGRAGIWIGLCPFPDDAVFYCLNFEYIRLFRLNYSEEI